MFARKSRSSNVVSPMSLINGVNSMRNDIKNHGHYYTNGQNGWKMLWMMIHYQTLNINEGENRRIDRFKNSLPVILFSDMAPKAVPDRSKASSIGITFNRWLKNPKDNGNIGEKMKPVIAPRSDKLANVKPIIQTKSSQAIERANAPNQIILKHFVTDTYTDRTASVSRPIYFDERLRVKLSKSL